MQIQRVAVFCGSSDLADQSLIDLAETVGRRLAEYKIGVVYGGGRSGLMGAVARGAMGAGGEVIGVIPRGLFANEIPDGEVTERRVVADMHERKKTMYHLSDAFLCLPGGLGTADELFEAATWTQLGLHRQGRDRGPTVGKAVVLLATDGYWDGIVAWLNVATEAHLVGDVNRAIIRSTTSVDGALAALAEDPTRERPNYVIEGGGDQ